MTKCINLNYIKDITKNVYHLKNFPELNQLLTEKAESQVTFKHFITDTVTAVSPLISDIVFDDILQNVSPDDMQFALHYSFILNTITEEGASNPQFLQKYMTQIYAVRKEKGAKNFWGVWRTTKNILFAIKTKTIDCSINSVFAIKMQQKETAFTKVRNLIYNTFLLTLNIFEAVMIDKNMQNKLIGSKLALNIIPPNAKFIEIYFAWNLAFVIGTLNKHRLMIPKLIIPAVSKNKEFHTYFYPRGIALFIAVNNFILADNNINTSKLKNSNKIVDKLVRRINDM